MRMKTERRRKLLMNTREYIEEKQDTFLQSETLIHYRNRCIRSYYRSDILIERRINNISIEDYELSEMKLWNL